MFKVNSVYCAIFVVIEALQNLIGRTTFVVRSLEDKEVLSKNNFVVPLEAAILINLNRYVSVFDLMDTKLYGSVINILKKLERTVKHDDLQAVKFFLMSSRNNRFSIGTFPA